MAPLFDYQAFHRDGKQSKGTVEAESSKSARLKLKKQGLMVTAIYEKSASQKGKRASGSLGGKIKIPDLALMTRQLASLIKANIPLVEALNALVDQTESERLKVVIDQIRKDVNEGSSLAKALRAHPKAFDHIYVNMVEAGESSGTLGLVLLRLADLKEAQLRLRNKLISAMTYPIIIVCVAIILLVAIFAFVIPKLTKIFASTNKPLPATTKFLIAMSDTLTNYWYVFATGAVLFFFFFRRYIATTKGRIRWDRFKLSSPVFGMLFRMIAVTRFSRTMGTLFGSGVPILTCLSIAKNLVGNVLIEKAISEARENITEGQSIADPLRKSGEFPPLVIHMIAIGEKTGELSGMLNSVADTYEEQVNSKIEGLTSMLEPMMIVIMGGIVLFIILSIFMPLMEISNIS